MGQDRSQIGSRQRIIMLTNNNFVVSSLLCVSGFVLRERAAGFSQPLQSGSREAGTSGQQLWGLPRIHTGAQSGPEQEGPQVRCCSDVSLADR